MKKYILTMVLALLLIPSLAFSQSPFGAIPPDDTAYNATTWNGSLRAPTKNAVRDYFESIGATFHIDDILTALGIVSEAVHFGTFTGTIIPDSSTAKEALQALETEVETKLAFADAAATYETLLINSAGLLAALSDETGTGLAVFGTAPTFTTSINFNAVTDTVAGIQNQNLVDKSADEIWASDKYLGFGTAGLGRIEWVTANTRLELKNDSDTPIFWFDFANSAFGVAAVTGPENSLFDSDAAGAERTDEYAGGIGANMTTTTEDAEVSDVTLYYMKAGTKTAGLVIDGTDGSVSALVKTTIGSGAISQTAQNEYVICTAACQVTPLVAAVGQQLCVRNAPGSATVAQLVLRVNQYYELTDHTAWATVSQRMVSGGAVTDSICIVGYDATHYATMNHVGTWTDTAAP